MARKKNAPIRYAVVGLGHISQSAVLPAFENARLARATALVSSDREKLEELGRQYGIDTLCTYEDYSDLLAQDAVDAVYIGLPNDMHCEYTVAAAQAGVHVLCEKPLAVTEGECQRMIDACADGGVHLMCAYRLHLEPANLKAIELVRDGRLGDVRYFSSDFSLPVKQGNIRVQRARGGGTLYDLGVYCINAARSLFDDEPFQVYAVCAARPDPRFREVEETATVVLRFPHDRLATFTTSFGATSLATYRLVGTDGYIEVDPAYEYASGITVTLHAGDDTQKLEFAKRDQFAAELDYFAECILDDRHPEPDGREGLIDVRVVEAAYRSAIEGRPVDLGDLPRKTHARPEQAMWRPPVEDAPPEVKASGPRAE